MWKLGLRPRNSFFWKHFRFEFSMWCLSCACSQQSEGCPQRRKAERGEGLWGCLTIRWIHGEESLELGEGMLETELAYSMVWLRACLRQVRYGWAKMKTIFSQAKACYNLIRHSLARWRMAWVSEWHASTLQRKSHLCIPFLGTARPQPQFPHPCVCERFMSQERSLQCRKCLTCGRWSEDMFKPSEAMLGTSNGMQY